MACLLRVLPINFYIKLSIQKNFFYYLGIKLLIEATMYKKHLIFSLLITPFCISAMDCFVTRTFNNEPFTPTEQKNLLALLKSLPTIMDENGNTILHVAAAVYEWPEAVNELILARPELAEYMHQPNNKGTCPADLVRAGQERYNQAILKAAKVARLPQSNSINVTQDQIKQLDNSIDAKLALSDQNKPHAPFTDLEKGRILSICIQFPNPLHFAAQISQYPEMITHLLAYNSQLATTINTPNHLGQTALSIAIAKKNVAAQILLKQLGAQTIP